jgi:hypothetical protein
MNAIGGQESGGDYNAENSDSGASGRFQIMPENWPSWAEEAGLGADAPMTAANQDKVAKYKMLQYYEQFGNWRDVAIAWYGGAGAVSYSEAAKNAKQHFGGTEYPSINEYADSVMDRMGLNRDGTSKHKQSHSNLGGDAAAANAVAQKVGEQWMGGATDDPTIQCDSFTAYIYNTSGIPSVGGHSTEWGNTINDDHFRAANAWHDWSGASSLQNGDMVGWDWGNGRWHYGIFNADEGVLVSRDSKGGIQQRSIPEAMDLWGTPAGYGSISEAEAARKGISPMAYNGGGGASLMSTGIPTWQRLNQLKRNSSAADFAAAMTGKGPLYGGGIGGGFGGVFNGRVDIGGITVNVTEPGATAQDIARATSAEIERNFGQVEFFQKAFIAPNTV